MISLDSGFRGIGKAPELEGTGLTVSAGPLPGEAFTGAVGLTAGALIGGAGTVCTRVLLLQAGQFPWSSRNPSQRSHNGIAIAADMSGCT